jgi:hypothetical protein
MIGIFHWLLFSTYWRIFLESLGFAWMCCKLVSTKYFPLLNIDLFLKQWNQYLPLLHILSSKTTSLLSTYEHRLDLYIIWLLFYSIFHSNQGRYVPYKYYHPISFLFSWNLVVYFNFKNPWMVWTIGVLLFHISSKVMSPKCIQGYFVLNICCNDYISFAKIILLNPTFKNMLLEISIKVWFFLLKIVVECKELWITFECHV